MNEKEIGEIRRRVRRDRSNMSAVYGCYVNGQKEIVSEFRRGTGTMSENEAEKYFGLMKRVLSGSVGKNLLDIRFRTAQVAQSEEHKLLMDLRGDIDREELRLALYAKIMENVHFDDGFLILLGKESYDVPIKSKDDTLQADASNEIYTYLLCAVCPVKLTKSTLCYDAQSRLFHDGGVTNAAAAPEIGFLFPAFDDRRANIYNALYYTRSPKDNHPELAQALFCVEPPKPAFEQKKSFEALLGAALEEECSLEVVQAVHEQLCQTIQMHKESRVEEPLLVSKEQVKSALYSCGVSDASLSKFSVQFDETFGHEAELHPKNIIDNKHFEIATPDVSIKVNPERSDLIETRVIGGVKYLMICADENVEVNGVSIHIQEK